METALLSEKCDLNPNPALKFTSSVMLGKLYTLSTSDSSSQIRDLATKLLGSWRTLTGITETHQIIPFLC